MLTLPDYKIHEKIYASPDTEVYRGFRYRDKQQVIFKILKEDYPSQVELSQYKHEFNITNSLNVKGVVQVHSLEKYKNSLVIIFEDNNGKSLSALMSDGVFFSTEEFLSIAIKIANVLGGVHSANVIHKDISPSNIIFNQKTGKLEIIDFAIASALSYENPVIKNPNVIEGTLAYMSPEQTGRMNRLLDYRTDFYSLGATLYELICRKLPFQSNDSLEIIHFHIARKPVSPHEFDSKIHKTISDIIMKLLAKNAEDRYQSAWGIKADFEECLNQLKVFGKIESFPIALHDISERFQISHKLYGREKEIEILTDTFEQVCSGKRQFLAIAGYSGIGKTSIVKEIYKPITLRKGYFISGKFDQLNNIPYSAIINAFRELIRQLLAEESDAGLVKWKERILAVFGPNGQIIIDVIPEIELIVGPQPNAPQIGSIEAQNRFNMIFQNFLLIFCRREHPLTIFLDNLQWADIASLKLMQLMMTNNKTRYFFLITAYRDNEITPVHPVMVMFAALKNEGISINQIILTPLKLKDIAQLISDSLHVDKELTMPLAELSLNKTDGNPFFIGFFLKSLYKKKLLISSPNKKGKNRWTWNLKKIQTLDITNNVIELLMEKIQQFDKETQRALKIASCIGNRFNAQILAMIYGSVDKTITALQQAVSEGIILPIGDAYKLTNFNENEQLIEYKFSHDRIQQAAYALFDEIEKKETHQQIGKYLLEHTEKDQIEEKIFDIVNQLNLSKDLIENQSEKNELAQLNLIAAGKAKASVAFGIAFDYLKIGIESLCENCWEKEYNLTLSLYVEAAETAYLFTDFAQMEQFAQVVLQQAQTLLDKVKIYKVQIEAGKAQCEFTKTLETALSILKQLNVKFPTKPTKLSFLIWFAEIKLSMMGKRIENFANLPEMNDDNKLAAMHLLNRVGSAAYFVAPDLLPLLVLKSVKFSIKYGNAPESAFSYAVYGMISCGVIGRIKSGYKFGQLALRVLEQFNVRKFKAMTFHMVYGFIVHWKTHIRETMQPLLEGYQSGLETGDFEYAGFCAFFYSYHSYLFGEELSKLSIEMARLGDAIKRLEHKQVSDMQQIFQQAVLNLQEESENPSSLIGKYYNEEHSLPVHNDARDGTTLYLLYINKFILSYLFCDYSRAVKNGIMAEKYLDSVIGMFVVPLFFFYDSLNKLALFDTAPKSERKKILKKVNSNQRKMKKLAHHAPMNHLHKFYLVEAERMKALNKNAKSCGYYDQAIELAKKHKYVNEEALANELAAKFYLKQKNITIAKAYIQEALYCYSRWGANAKVKDLDVRYGDLFSDGLSAKSEIKKFDIIRTSLLDSTDSLDLASLLKTSQAISSEIVMEKLLAGLMKIVIENTGAQTGFLLLESNGNLLIEATGTLDAGNAKLSQIPLEKSDSLSIAVVKYVARTHKYVVLNNAAIEGNFTTDSYIKTHSSKSILCVPIIHKAKLIGVLYLENNLTADVFTIERMKIIKFLSSQIAISLENAKLYKSLQESENRYRELYDNIIDIVILVDMDDKILMANPLFYSIIGISQSNHSEFTFKRLVHTEDHSNIEKNMLTKLLKGESVRDFEFRLVNKSGKVIAVECNTKPIKKGDKIIGFQMVMRDITVRKRMANDLFESIQDLQNARVGTILGLAKLAEYRDEDTGAHLERIREYAKIITLELAKKPKYKNYITEKYVEDIYFSSVLHDIGKVGISDAILLKPSKLTAKEFEEIKRHPVIGGDVLKEVEKKVGKQSFLVIGGQIAYYHHEKWDGSGYAKGLKGEEIPLSARIVALVDVYDALTTKRIYKEAYSHEKTKKIIVDAKGKHFDPEIVDAFLVLEDTFNVIREQMHQVNEAALSE